MPFLAADAIEHRLEFHHDPPGLSRMRTGAYPEIHIWLWQIEVAEESVAHRSVVVLAGMHQRLFNIA